MSATMLLPQGYGYVVLVALGAIPILSTAQGAVVTELRKKAGTKYPNYMATDVQAKESQDAYAFNCAQRAHANLMENMPQTIISMLFAGLEYPQATAALGLGWTLCRVAYAYGYIKKGAEARKFGGAFWLFQGGIWGLCMSSALKFL